LTKNRKKLGGKEKKTKGEKRGLSGENKRQEVKAENKGPKRSHCVGGGLVLRNLPSGGSGFPGGGTQK